MGVHEEPGLTGRVAPVGPAQGPLVVIGIPTYNRCVLLDRCLQSALAQTYEHIEVRICDNASTDGTQQYCEQIARLDPRVHYHRNASNIGGTANFNAVLERAEGEYFMWLADDDWIEPNYVRQCVTELRRSPALVVACGLARYETQERSWLGDDLQCGSTNPLERVLSYYRQVQDNGVFYGVMRRAVIAQMRLRNCIGGDWLFMAAIAFRGQLRTLDVGLHREPGGASASRRRMAQALKLPTWQGFVPVTVTLSINACVEALRAGGSYANAQPLARLAVAVLVPLTLFWFKPRQEIARRWRRIRSARAA